MTSQWKLEGNGEYNSKSRILHTAKMAFKNKSKGMFMQINSYINKKISGWRQCKEREGLTRHRRNLGGWSIYVSTIFTVIVSQLYTYGKTY